MPDVCHAKTKDLPGMRNHIQMNECVSGMSVCPPGYLLPFTLPAPQLSALEDRWVWTIHALPCPLIFDWICQRGALTEARKKYTDALGSLPESLLELECSSTEKDTAFLLLTHYTDSFHILVVTP